MKARTHPNPDEEGGLERLTQLNIVEQMAHLHTHPAIEARVRADVLGIHGWYYESEFEPWPDPV